MRCNRRRAVAGGVLAACGLLPGASLTAWAQSKKDTLTLAVALEPAGLDPTASAASSIAEVVLYNVFETLTKINADGSVAPLLAQSWDISPDLKTYTFKLRQDTRFHNGAHLSAETVKFSFDRAGHPKSANKDRPFFAKLTTKVIAPYTVQVHNQDVEPDFLFLLGQASAIIVEPRSAAQNASNPIGTGPYRLQTWVRGSAVTLVRWDEYRLPKAARLRQATFRFIADPPAQVAALLAGDVELFARMASGSIELFKAHPRFQVSISSSRAKTIVAMNHARKPLADVRVRCAIAAAIDRTTLIQGGADGLGVAIGSHYVPGAFGYVDTTGIHPYHPEKAKALLQQAQQAGIKMPLRLTMTLPPTPYARQGGPIIAAELAKVGIVVKLQPVDWAQWLSGTYGAKKYDLTLITHVEPFDLGHFARSDYYWGYQSPAFNALFAKIQQTLRPADRARLLGEAQRLLAEDCVHAFLYQPQWVTVAHKELRGLWKDMPILVNDLSSLYWM